MSKLFAGLPDDLPEDAPREEPLPQELQGKSPAEVYKMLQDENSRLLKEQELQLKAQAYDSRGTAAPEPQKTPPQQYYQAPQQGPPAGEEFDIYSNPEGFMDQQMQRRMGPIIQTTFNSLRESNKAAFAQQIGSEEWDRYGGEIEQFVGSLNPQVQVDPKSFRVAYNYVRSLHLDEITESKANTLAEQRVRERLEAMGVDPDAAEGTTGTVEQRVQQAVAPTPGRSSLFQRDVGTVPAAMGRSSKPATAAGVRSRLTPEEKKAAEMFSMTDEEYAAYARMNTDVYSTMGGE